MILVTAPVSWGVMTVGNVMPGVGIECTSLMFWARVLTITPPRFPDVTTLTTPTCVYGSLNEVSEYYYLNIYY